MFGNQYLYRGRRKGKLSYLTQIRFLVEVFYLLT